MKCPNILNLNFSLTGKKALKKIRRKQKLANVLSSVLASSVLLEIFIGNSVLGSANNIQKKDWDLWAKAMRSVPNILSREIDRIAKEAFLNPNIATKERKFWDAIIHGCR